MSEIIYTVTATLPDTNTAGEWLRWLREGHIAAILASGATAAEIIAVDGKPNWFEVRYRFPSREAFDRYEREIAPRLRAEGLKRFPVDRGIVYQRSVGVVQERFGQGC
jgi:Domain of unknown function (DUF4286)